jgi:hypothetical protein
MHYFLKFLSLQFLIGVAHACVACKFVAICRRVAHVNRDPRIDIERSF